MHYDRVGKGEGGSGGKSQWQGRISLKGCLVPFVRYNFFPPDVILAKYCHDTDLSVGLLLSLYKRCY